MCFNGFLRYDTTGKKKVPVVCLAKKKRYSHLSMYFNGFLRHDRKKKVPVVCLAKKKRYSRLSVGCAVLAEKKKIQSSVQFVLVQLELKLIQIR
jgi:hypothetical protein